MLDDFQELSDDSATCTLVYGAMGAVGPRLCHHYHKPNPPPAALALGRTCDTTLGEADIALTHSAAGRWTADLTLTFEESRTVGSPGLVLPEWIHGSLFDYFTNGMCYGLAADTRDGLLTISLAPSVTASMAARLSGHEHAGDILTRLARRHYFTVRLGTAPETYAYHIEACRARGTARDRGPA